MMSCRLVVLLITLFLASYTLSANRSVGSVVQLVGVVEVADKHGRYRRLNVRDKVFSGDMLVTRADGWLTVNFYDLTRVVLRPDSEFVIDAFPSTMDKGDVALRINRGGVRMTSGLIASQSQERFILSTPSGNLSVGRAEWVVRICDGDECDPQLSNIKQCAKYENGLTTNRQFVSVYKGEVNAGYCPESSMVSVGTSSVFGNALAGDQQECVIVDEIPCFVLFDKQLGRGKVRIFRRKLTPVADSDIEDDPERDKRPDSRQVRPAPRARMPRPRIERPRPNRR
jgi:FecR protein